MIETQSSQKLVLKWKILCVVDLFRDYKVDEVLKPRSNTNTQPVGQKHKLFQKQVCHKHQLLNVQQIQIMFFHST